MLEKKIYKDYLRKKYLSIRENLSKDYIDEKSIQISNKLFKTKQYKTCENIFIYLSFNKEINTNYIINQSIKDNINIFCPIINKKREMVFKKFEGFNNLKKNKFGILEPISDFEKISNNKTLIIVPGLVYNEKKYRIGYGGGYYDKFLSTNKYLSSIGICLDIFTKKSFKEENFDEKVDFIISEKNIY